MKFVLKMIRFGLYGTTILLTAKPMTASSAVIQSPVITLQHAIARINGPVTLQWTPKLSSPTWQTLGSFSGSTNLYFFYLSSAFFRGVCSNATISAKLTWPASTNTSVVGYKVYYGTASGAHTDSLDVGPATTATVSNLTAGTRYYFAATAYNASGVEGPFSNETSAAFQVRFSLGLSGLSRIGGITRVTVTQTAADAVAIPPPLVVITKKVTAAISNPVTLQFTTNLSSPHWQPLGTFSGTTNISFTNLPAVFIRGYCTNLTASATLAWWPSSESSVVGYKLYYGTASHTYTKVINVGPATTATISNLVSGKTYYFAVTAYDSSGLESSFSNEASGTFQPTFSLTIGSP